MIFKQPKTVDSVLASFRATINDLENIINRETANIEKLNIEMAGLEAQKINSQQEAAAAETIAAKISKLISA
jgi:hypothetical protein